MFIGGPDGLYAKLPAGKYTAIIQHNVQQADGLSLPANVDFEVTAGRQVVVEVEIQPLMLEGLVGAGSELSFGDEDYDGSDYGDLGYDGYNIDSSNYGGWGYDSWDHDVNAAYGGAGLDAQSATSRQAASKKPSVDPWMADANDHPDIRPYGPYDE